MFIIMQPIFAPKIENWEDNMSWRDNIIKILLIIIITMQLQKEACNITCYFIPIMILRNTKYNNNYA